MARPSFRTRRPRRLLALTGVTLLTVATACGDDDDDDAASTDAPAAASEAPEATQASDAPASTDAAEATEPAETDAAADTEASTGTDGGGSAPGGAGDATVTVGDSELGQILVDGAGRTLYVFVPDAQGASTCTEGCLDAWPAIPGPATAGAGVDEALLGTATRPDDGSEQATCDGWPLYLFAQDSAAGDVLGQGIGDNWYVLDATCTPVGMP